MKYFEDIFDCCKSLFVVETSHILFFGKYFITKALFPFISEMSMPYKLLKIIREGNYNNPLNLALKLKYYSCKWVY